MVKLSGRLRAGLAVSAVAAAPPRFVVNHPPPASASANVCTHVPAGYSWSTEQDMADSSSPSCRWTWMVDPGQGNLLTRKDLVQQHAGFYASWGFSKQFLWYAPDQWVTVAGGS